MRALLIWTRADVRRRLGTLLGLALLIALAGGTTMAALAGARRSATAYERLRDRTHAMDAAVFGSGAAVRRAVTNRRVAASARFSIAGIAWVGNHDLFPFVEPHGGAFGRTIERPMVLAGRRADPRASDEIVLPEGVARSNHLAVGDRMRFVSVRPGDAATAQNGIPVTNGPRFVLRVVGISRSASGLAVRDRDIQFVFLTPAWVRRFGSDVAVVGDGTVVRLHRGSDAFGRWSRAVNPRADAESHPTPLFSPAPVEDSIAVIVDGLRLFALVAALAGIVAIVQAVERHATGSAGDLDVLGGLGATRRQRSAAMLASITPALVLGAFGALGLAFVWSPLMPIGLARRAEPDRGWSFDGLVLGGGVVILLVVLVAVASVVSWRISVGPGDRPSSRRVRFVGLAGVLPPVPATGIQLATTRGRGREVVPLRSAMAGIAVAIAGVVAVTGFAAGLDRLVREPRRYGVPWDATAVLDRDQPVARDVARLVRIPQVGAVAVVHAQLDGLLDGRSDGGGVAITAVRGPIAPVTRSGSVPTAPGEIAVGADTAARLGVVRGDHVTLTGSKGSRRLTVVGEALLPTVDDPALLASGFVVTPATARSLGLEVNDAFRRAVVRFRPGVARAAGIRALRAAGFRVSVPAPPPEVARLREVQSLPRTLATILAVIGAVVVDLALIVTVRRRRRDLALLRVLGFTGRQVVGSVLWQATIVTFVGLVVGIPVGLILGRYVWARIADGLGVATTPAFAGGAVALTAFGALVVAGLSAVVPAARAARLRPASILRDE